MGVEDAIVASCIARLCPQPKIIIMKRFRLNWFPLLALLVFIVSCQSEHDYKKDALKYIPDDINSLMIIDMPDLMAKADYDALIQLPVYKRFILEAANENPTIAKVLEDPRRSGLDVSQHFYFAMQQDFLSQRSRSDKGYLAFVAAVEDKEALEQNMSALDIQFVPASQNFGYSKAEDIHIVWNDEVLIMGAGPQESAWKRDLEAFLNTTPKNSIAKNRNLQKSLEKDFDIANWSRIDAMLKIDDENLFTTLLGIDQKDLSDNYVNSYLHFRKGEIEGESYFDLKRGLTNDLQLLFKDEVKTKFGKFMPGENLVGMMAAAIDLKGINQLLIEKHVKGAGMQKLEEFGLSFEDFVRAFSGEVAIALYATPDDDAAPLVVLPIEKKKRFETLLNFALDKEILVDLGNGRYALEARSYDDGMLLRVGDMLYVSNNEYLLDKIASDRYDRGGQTIENMANLMPDNIVSAYTSSNGIALMDDAIKDMPFDEFKMIANRKKVAFLIKMKNGDSNALWQFFNEMNKVYLREGGDKS